MFSFGLIAAPCICISSMLCMLLHVHLPALHAQLAAFFPMHSSACPHCLLVVEFLLKEIVECLKKVIRAIVGNDGACLHADQTSVTYLYMAHMTT